MGKAESVRGGTGNGGLGRADGSALQDFGKQQPVMATVRRQNRHGGKRVYNRSSSSAGGGREAEGGRAAGEGFPDFALSPLCSGGAPGLGSAADPPSPALLVGGGGTSCLWGRLLLLRSGDQVPNTPAASLRDAHLTDSRPSQSSTGPGKGGLSQRADWTAGRAGPRDWRASRSRK